jgi:hypothetical protein
VRESDALERPDKVPADIRLPPAESEARGASVRMMVGVPVFTPGRDLEGTEPPHVHAGVLDAFFGVAEMREAIYEALHVQRIDQTDCADPKETHPTKTEQKSGEDRENNYGSFELAPRRIHAPGQFGSPALLISGLRLVEPAQMRPPEAALLGAGNIVRGVRDGMMKAMVGDPACGMAGTIENRPKDENLLDKLIDLKGLVRKQPVIANRGSEPSEGDEQERQTHHFQAREREQNQPNKRERVYQDEICEDALFAAYGFPEWTFPRPRFLCGD